MRAANPVIHIRTILAKMLRIHFFRIVLANEFNAVFQDRHHSQAQEIDLNDSQCGTVIFVPLHHNASRHSSWFKWNDRIQLPLANDHTARMLSEMPWQILDSLAQIFEQCNLWVRYI